MFLEFLSHASGLSHFFNGNIYTFKNIFNTSTKYKITRYNSCVQREVRAVQGSFSSDNSVTATTQTVHVSTAEGVICNDSENAGGCDAYSARVCCAQVKNFGGSYYAISSKKFKIGLRIKGKNVCTPLKAKHN